MPGIRSLVRECRGSSAAELALILPLLLTMMFGALETGNYFMNEHTLVKAVRDGARFAARQSFTNYAACSGSPGGTVVADTRNVVMRGYVSGGTIITPRIQTSDVDVTTSCKTMAGGQTMSGIYTGRANGAQIVTVSASVDYVPIIGFFGIGLSGMELNARSEAAVAGM